MNDSHRGARRTGSASGPNRRHRRSIWGPAIFGGLAVIGVPLAVVVTQGGAQALARGPLGSVIERVRTTFDGAALDRIEGLEPLISPAATAADVEPALVGAIIFAESRGVSGQTSSAGALGLMQLVPAAARDAARRIDAALPASDDDLREALLHDDALNVRLGTAHLAWLLENRGDWSLEAVLVSYNAGRRRLFDWIEPHGSYQGWVQSQESRIEANKTTSGALQYARKVLAVRATFLRRGVLAGPTGDLAPARNGAPKGSKSR